ncbi:dihydrolipoyl dehydrogenase [Microbacterium oryzae]|uniref:Dihydrolipoyl dehydrogenase n=1 Tax=Microbacterium oryzae TaxID=743009 RepID=A0A6I6E478_9MICO|nr:dihydrolipoyl dehydrogenase [Microbacterium oryzae]QGU26601.1 dihydrolipoyl dehydrogenase [Microbacterium oryzae]
MTERSFDLVVLGGGSGGYAAALRAAELGRSVAVVERDKVGGTCLHRGCVPTKALLHAAEVADTVRDAARYGIDADLVGIDAARIATYREGIVAKKHKGLEGLLKARGIVVVPGEGRLESGPAVRVGDELLRARDVVLATGSYSRTLPGIEIGGRIITSEGALELGEVPRSAIILGGGVIGAEFASLWRSLGADVTIVEALDHLVPNEDVALSKGLERAYRRRGIGMSLGVRFASATQDDDGVTVALESGATLTADVLLVAVGRGPVTDGIGLEEVGVRRERGFVVVDEQLRTNVPNVWAVGDIVPGLQLAHRSFQQGIAAAERIAGMASAPVPDTHVPRVTYSHPELASVGVTEAQAVAAHGEAEIETAEFNLAGNARSEIIGTGGLVKVIRRKNGPVLGVHLIGDRVSELITEGQLAVAWDAHPEDIAPLIHAHPTQSEALGEAFLALAGKPLHAL